MKKAIIFLLIGIMFITCSLAQPLTGVKTVGSGGDYATIEAAITALNASGVGPGGVSFNVVAGHTETFTSPTKGIITATGTSSDPIVFRKSGLGINPKITAGTGTSTTTDGIIKIAGGDYITFDGIDVAEKATNTSSTTRMEWGYALVKASATNGAQNNTIKNCTITLNKSNTASVGVYGGNHIATSAASQLTVTALSGSNSNNTIENCQVTNSYIGISLNGFNDPTTPYSYYDMNNIVSFCSISNYCGGSSGNGIITIYNGNIKILNDTITGGTSSGTIYGINISTATSQNITISGNRIYGLSTSNTTNNSQVPIYCNSGSTAAGNTVLISNNLIENCFHSSTGTGAKFYGIRTTSSAENLIIRKNIIRNNFLKSPSINSFLACVTHESNATNCNIDSNEMYGNYITSNSSNSFPLYCIYSLGSSTASITSVNDNILYNNSIQCTGSAGNLYAICNTTIASSEAYYRNSIHDNSHSGTGPVYGIYLSNSNGTKNIYNDTIYNQTGNATVGGIYSNYGAPLNCYNNKIYNLQTNSTTGMCYGIDVPTGGSTINIYNNFISSLKAPLANADDVIRGINISNTTTSSTIGVYFNTIYLDATSSGTNFGTSGIYHAANTTATTATLDMRNNIIVNNSTPNGTGKTVAFRRSSTSLGNFNSASNNNCLYAGTPGSSRLLFYDGTNSDQTISTYKTRVTPKETNSFSEIPPFINTLSTPYDLHLNTTTPTYCESGGLPVTTPSITTDYDSDTRNASTPDVGADEGSFAMMSGVWTGAISMDWSIAGNWSKSSVPDNTVNVVISSTAVNQPHVTMSASNPAVCMDLTINTGAVLTVDADKALSIGGTITNNSGTTGLILKSDAIGTGSLIQSTTGVSATVERYFADNGNVSAPFWQWHFLSSPISNQKIVGNFINFSGSPAVGDINVDFYRLDPTNATTPWVNIKQGPTNAGQLNPDFDAAHPADPEFAVGTGYLVSYNYASSVKTFSGTLNATTVSPSLVTGTNKANLIGNPYTSAIDWDLITKTGLENGYYYIYNDATDDFEYYLEGGSQKTAGVNGKIPAMQAFYVANSSAASIDLPLSARVHNTQAYLKSTNTVNSLNLIFSNGTKSDETKVFVNSNASNGIDWYDATKMFSFDANKPQIYSIVDNTKKVAFNSIAGITNTTIIPLVISVPANGNYSIAADGLNSFPANTYIYLKDLKINTIQDLNQNANYSFAGLTTDNASRFQLIFALSPLDINEQTTSNANIYTYENIVYINSKENVKQIKVYNTVGQLIKTVSNVNGLQIISLSGNATGYYIIKVITDKNVYLGKVLIN
jgi:hypothetical protein